MQSLVKHSEAMDQFLRVAVKRMVETQLFEDKHSEAMDQFLRVAVKRTAETQLFEEDGGDKTQFFLPRNWSLKPDWPKRDKEKIVNTSLTLYFCNWIMFEWDSGLILILLDSVQGATYGPGHSH
jgi:hypothetical protein